jgi:glutamyl-tRNA synthetase
MTPAVRVRFAPSPTGMLHIGGLRTALYNYLFARRNNGTFVLRIEDTDQNRYVEGAEDDIRNSLKWAGLLYDEGPDAGGDTGPYRQSERSELYINYARQLVENGNAYYAFDTAEEIESMREHLKTADNPTPKYDANTRLNMKNSLTLDQTVAEQLIADGTPYVIRLKVPEAETVQFDDLVRGSVSFGSEALDDQVLLKSDGLPTYHLANVVDDHLMGISHVIRGEEWLSSAPKHILLYRCFGWEPPVMAHLPLIMSPAGGKLSKRNAEELGIPVNVRDYMKHDYEPEAVVNFLAFLGWSPGDDREIMTLDELTEAFSLEKVGKAGSIFNFDKLKWYNAHYLRSRDDASFLNDFRKMVAEAGFTDFGDHYLLGVIHLLKERIQLASELLEQGIYFFAPPSSYDEKASAKAWKGNVAALVTIFRQKISADVEFKSHELKATLTAVVEEQAVGFGKLMSPLRIAVTGVGGGPDLFETMELIGQQEVLSRIDAALTVFGEQ